MTRLLLVAAALVAVLAAAGVGVGAELHVHPGESIQDAIDGAGAGDAIYVHAGTYDENVDVWKRVTLIGDGADVVTVRAADASDHVFEVTADYVSISGFAATGALTQTGGYKTGINLNNANHCNIYDNNASDNNRGIYLYCSCNYNMLTNNNCSNNNCGIDLYKSSSNTLTNNTANSNNGDGIVLGSSGSNTLANNTASNNRYGIWLDYSSNNTLTNNTANSNEDTDSSFGIVLHFSSNNVLSNNIASNNDCGIALLSSGSNTLTNNIMDRNKWNFYVYGHYGLSDYTQNIDTSNTVDRKPIYYWVDRKDRQIPSDAGFVGVVNGTNITVRDLTLTNNGEGVLFVYTENSRIENVTASNNSIGIYLHTSSNNMLESNTADLNIGIGIYLRHSSDNNTFYHNTLIDNTQNAYDTCTNQWDSGTAGNYWSDYLGNDTNRDGIGETPYDIPGGESVDRYPLTGIRWLPPEITRSRLGINTHWNHWAENLSIYEQKTKGFGVVRDQAWWAGLETTDLTGSEWDYANWNYSYSTKTLCGKEVKYKSGLDNLVKLYQDGDSPELLLLLNLKNDDISSFETITVDQYYDYVYHVVERYDGDGVSDMPGLIRPVRGTV